MPYLRACIKETLRFVLRETGREWKEREFDESEDKTNNDEISFFIIILFLMCPLWIFI